MSKLKTPKQKAQWEKRRLKGDLLSLPNWVNSVCSRLLSVDSTLSNKAKIDIRIAAQQLDNACRSAFVETFTEGISHD